LEEGLEDSVKGLEESVEGLEDLEEGWEGSEDTVEGLKDIEEEGYFLMCWILMVPHRSNSLLFSTNWLLVSDSV
jgi:hypothetical protein